MITLLGEERADLSAFRTFVRFALVWFLSVSSFSWCLGRVAVCDCGTHWTFLLPFSSKFEQRSQTPIIQNWKHTRTVLVYDHGVDNLRVCYCFGNTL